MTSTRLLESRVARAMVDRREDEGSDIRAALERHHERAFAWALTCAEGDRSLAEDVLHTSYLKVLDGRARYEGRAPFRTWLFSVIRNTARDAWRSAWWRRREPLPEEDTCCAPATDPDTAIELEAVARAMQQLPRRQAQVLSLVFGHGMTVGESAEVLGIARGSAAMHLHRAKQRLRAQLIPPENSDE